MGMLLVHSITGGLRVRMGQWTVGISQLGLLVVGRFYDCFYQDSNLDEVGHVKR